MVHRALFYEQFKMKEINTIRFLIILSAILTVSCLPTTDEESPENGKAVPPAMQSLLADIARELIARSTTNNQVLTLNVTNLIILLVLKSILWGASYVGTGGAQKGRLDDVYQRESLITETEILLLLSYLMGDETKNFECLHRIACEDSNKAKEYMNAGLILINATKYIGINSQNEQKYEKLLKEMNEVIEFREQGGNCARYTCTHTADENTL